MLENMKNKFIEVIKKKWLRNMGLTILLFAIIIAAYIGAYYGISLIHITDLDFTQEKIYSITKETEDKVKNIDEEVTIYLYNMYEYAEDFAYKYSNINSNIKVEKIENLNSKGEWKLAYGVEDTSSFIMIETKEKQKILSSSDLYTIDYTTYQEIDITEEALTNAILDVTTNVRPKIYFLSGHNLYPDTYFQYIQAALANEANDIDSVDLLVKGKVPDDCNLLVVTALVEDIKEKEKDSILKYIKNGGELLVLLDPTLGEVKTPNMDKVLAEYGVSTSEGVLLEGDSSKMLAGAPSFIISTINSSSEIVKNANMDMNLWTMNPGKLNIASSEELEKKNVTSEVLASVSDKAFYRTDYTTSSSSKISSDEDAGGAVIGAMQTKKYGDDKISKMIIFSNTAFATNAQVPVSDQYTMYAISMYNNEDIVLNSISYLTGREDSITIRKTPETISTYDVSAEQTYIVLGIIFAIPVFIIIVGIVVWILRRRK